MPKQVWITASVLAALVVALLLGYSFRQNSRELDALKSELKEARAAAADSEARLLELEQSKAEATHSRRSLEDEMRAALESKEVTISQLQGKLTVSILDRVLFDSGEAELRSEGEAVLRKIAGVLAQHTNLSIHVVGHTDNVPIRASARLRFASNWELSTARALAAVRFLTEKAGVNPRRVGAIGYGEFRPVADNATAEGRARNRRIAITMLSEELAGLDAVPGAITNAPIELPGLPPVLR